MPRKATKKTGALKPINPDSAEEKDSVISCLEQLVKSPGWEVISQNIRENIILKNGEILNDIHDKTPLYNEDDRLKDQRNFLLQLLNMPMQLLHELKGADYSPEEIEDDPYFKKEDFERK